jgi:hypothetical protein
MKKVILLILTVIVIASCKKAQVTVAPQKQLTFKNVVIIGNSMTFAPANEQIGWYGNWGMAASAEDSDYAHILFKRLQSYQSSCTLAVKNTGGFETEYKNYDIKAKLGDLIDKAPDLVIIKIGENVIQSTLDTAAFHAKFLELINAFRRSNPNVKIIACGTIWSIPKVENLMQSVDSYVSLAFITKDVSNLAYGKFSDPGIEQHPGDKGMKAIADEVWKHILTL